MYLCISFFSVATIKHHDQSSLWTEFVLDSWFQKRLSWPGSKAASSRMVAGGDSWEIISSNTRVKQTVTGSESEDLKTPGPLLPPVRPHLLHLFKQCQQWRSKCSNAQDYRGHFSFKPPPIASVLSAFMHSFIFFNSFIGSAED